MLSYWIKWFYTSKSISLAQLKALLPLLRNNCCQGASRMIQDKACLQDTHRLEIVDKIPDSAGILLSFHTGLVKKPERKQEDNTFFLYRKLGTIIVPKVIHTQSLLSPLLNIFSVHIHCILLAAQDGARMHYPRTYNSPGSHLTPRKFRGTFVWVDSGIFE